MAEFSSRGRLTADELRAMKSLMAPSLGSVSRNGSSQPVDFIPGLLALIYRSLNGKQDHLYGLLAESCEYIKGMCETVRLAEQDIVRYSGKHRERVTGPADSARGVYDALGSLEESDYPERELRKLSENAKRVSLECVGDDGRQYVGVTRAEAEAKALEQTQKSERALTVVRSFLESLRSADLAEFMRAMSVLSARYYAAVTRRNYGSTTQVEGGRVDRDAAANAVIASTQMESILDVVDPLREKWSGVLTDPKTTECGFDLAEVPYLGYPDPSGAALEFSVDGGAMGTVSAVAGEARIVVDPAADPFVSPEAGVWAVGDGAATAFSSGTSPFLKTYTRISGVTVRAVVGGIAVSATSNALGVFSGALTGTVLTNGTLSVDFSPTGAPDASTDILVSYSYYTIGDRFLYSGGIPTGLFSTQKLFTVNILNSAALAGSPITDQASFVSAMSAAFPLLDVQPEGAYGFSIGAGDLGSAARIGFGGQPDAVRSASPFGDTWATDPESPIAALRLGLGSAWFYGSDTYRDGLIVDSALEDAGEFTFDVEFLTTGSCTVSGGAAEELPVVGMVDVVLPGDLVRISTDDADFRLRVDSVTATEIILQREVLLPRAAAGSLAASVECSFFITRERVEYRLSDDTSTSCSVSILAGGGLGATAVEPALSQFSAPSDVGAKYALRPGDLVRIAGEIVSSISSVSGGAVQLATPVPDFDTASVVDVLGAGLPALPVLRATAGRILAGWDDYGSNIERIDAVLLAVDAYPTLNCSAVSSLLSHLREERFMAVRELLLGFALESVPFIDVDTISSPTELESLLEELIVEFTSGGEVEFLRTSPSVMNDYFTRGAKDGEG